MESEFISSQSQSSAPSSNNAISSSSPTRVAELVELVFDIRESERLEGDSSVAKEQPRCAGVFLGFTGVRWGRGT
jgi:hypothetical protein